MAKYRVVAFLDILGFKDLLGKNGADAIADKYSHVIHLVKSFNRDLLPNSEEPSLFAIRSEETRWCISKIFSDSIILVSLEDSEESCLRLLLYVWRLLQACLSIQMPFRGGIAYDEMCVDEDNEIFLGRALTKAYELEGAQEWIGAVIHEDIEKAFPNIFNGTICPYLKNIFLKYSVPFKGGARKRLHTMNWRFNLNVEEGTRSLMPYSTDKSVIKKVQNTLKYAQDVVQSGEVYVSDRGNAPIELRLFSCGSKLPPFPHGDDL